jgi:F-type H+-transporting ATPase subunit b
MRALVLALTLGASLVLASAPAHADLVPEALGTASARHADPHGLPAVTTSAPAAHGEHGGAEHTPAAHGEQASAGHGGEHAAGEHALAPINWSDFDNKKQPPYLALVINLAILLGIYFYFGKKPVVDGLKKRKEDIAKEIEEAARMQKEAQSRAKKYQASLANLDADLETTKKGLEEAGRVEKEKLVVEAKLKSERMMKDAAFLVEQESKQAEIDLKREAVLGSFGHAESFLSTRVTDDDHDRLCLEFLTELSKKPAVAREVSR